MVHGELQFYYPGVSISPVVGLRDLLLEHVRSDGGNRVMFHDGGDVLSPSSASLSKQNIRGAVICWRCRVSLGHQSLIQPQRPLRSDVLQLVSYH